MLKILTIASRDLRSYLNAFPFYWMLALFAAITGYFFWSTLSYFSMVSFQAATNPAVSVRGLNLTDGVMGPFLANVTALMLLFIPLLTMRSFSEERRSGTLELLVTYPVSDAQIVFGKFLALAGLLSIFILPTAFYFFLARPVHAVFEPVALGTGYLGLVLVGLGFISLCMFFSSLTEHQTIAAGTGFVLLLFFWVVGWVADWASPAMGAVFREISLMEHFRDFTRGILDTKDIAFFILFISFFLFATLSALEVRTWKR